MSDARETRAAVVVMGLLALLWGYSWVLAKIALRHCGPFDFAAIRTVLACLTLLPALLWNRSTLAAGHWRHAAVVGVVQTSLFLLLNNWALSEGAPGKTSVLVFTMPFWVLILAWPLLHERIQGWGWVAVGLAAGGLALILEPWNLGVSLAGKLLAVLAGVCWALGVVLAKRMHNRGPVDVLAFTFWQNLFGLPLLLLVAVLTHSKPIDLSTEFLVSGLLLGTVSSGGGWLMWLYVLHRLPAGTTSLSSLAIPVVALLSSALQLGERPGLLELAGMLLIGGSLALLSFDAVRRHQPQEALTGQE